MAHSLQIPVKHQRGRESGFTLVELLGICAILGLLATIGINLAVDLYEKARLASCLLEVKGIQMAVWDLSQEGEYIPDPVLFWETTWPDGRRHGPYYYIVDGDPNKGHGNDLDEVDEENPGASDPTRRTSSSSSSASTTTNTSASTSISSMRNRPNSPPKKMIPATRVHQVGVWRSRQPRKSSRYPQF